MKSYDARDWYWVVGGSQTHVFSSASGTFVSINNARYRAWVAAGGIATKIASAAELGEVLATYLVRPTDADVLDGFKDATAAEVIGRQFFRVIFNHENRLRAIERELNLNGSPADLTPNQARSAVKALM